MRGKVLTRISHNFPLFLRVLFTVVVILLVSNIEVCSAQAGDDSSSCVIMAKPGELYDLEVYPLDTGPQYTIIIEFDFKDDLFQRLEVQEPFRSNYDSESGLYCINDNSGAFLCSIEYTGVETVLLEERAILEVTSTDYQVRLLGVHQVVNSTTDVEIPKSFGIILALCSLVPFFLLAPDAISDLQAHLEVDTASKGVYGKILAILLPLLSIGLTFWLIESLHVFGG